MLKQLRNRKVMKRILWTIAIIIIPAFVFWGAGSAFRKQKGPDCAGTIFGRKVSFEEYSAAWQAVKNQALMMYGDKFNEIYETLDLNRQAWDRLILLAEAKKRRVRVSDQEVVGTIQGLPFLQSRGQFDKNAYRLILEQVFRMTAREFEEDMRGLLTIMKLKNAVIKNITVTDEEVSEAYRNENEKARIAYIMIPPDELKGGVTVDQKEIEAYYKNNTDSFRIPDQVNIEYMGFEFADYTSGIQITEGQITDYHNANKDAFDPKVDQKELREAIRNDLTRKAAREKALLAAEKIDYLLSDKTKSLEQAADENSLKIKETGFFGRQGPIPQIGWFPDIQKTAFKLKVGERSGLIKSNMDFVNGYYIIRLKEIKPSYIPPLSDVSGRIESIIKDNEAMKLAQGEADKVRAQILDLVKTKGVSFEEAAANLKREVKQAEPFARNSYIPGIGSADEISGAVFAAKPGEVSAPLKTRAGFCIFIVLEILPVNEEAFKKGKEEFAKKTLEAKEMKVLNDWYMELLKRADLKSNIPSEE
jgi:peptidyl-prolyl cis-trans isomerase D